MTPKTKTRLRWFLIAVGITGLSCLFTWWCMPEITEMSSVLSVRGQEGVSVTDFYNRLASRTIDRRDGGEVLCLSYEGSSRRDITTILNILTADTNRCPSVVALDFYFSSPKIKAMDDSLINALARCSEHSRLVMPYIVKYNEYDYLPLNPAERLNFIEQEDEVYASFTSDVSSYFNDTLVRMGKNVSFGVINLAANYFTDVMRDFRYEFPLSDTLSPALAEMYADRIIRSMPAEMAYQKTLADYSHYASEDAIQRIFYQEVERHFNNNNDRHVTINYMTDTVFVYNTECLLDTSAAYAAQREELLDVAKGRAVILGSLTEVKDVYITPLPDLQAGVLVHAYGADTILSNLYITHVPDWLAYLIAVLICIAFSYINCWALERTDIAVNSITRTLQFLFALFLIWFGYMFFVHGNVYIDLVISILMLATSAFAYDLYNGIVYTIRKIMKKQ